MTPLYDSQNMPPTANANQQHQCQGPHQHQLACPYRYPITQQQTQHNVTHQAQAHQQTTASSSSTKQRHQKKQQADTSRSVSQRCAGSLGSKDLIIRMLAEVFQVVRSESTGQLRWHQLSSSLIPISLYSRTTGKWLDYLTAASSLDSNQEQSAMSPDSRQFLLLLQQIHHQQQQQQDMQSASIHNNNNQRSIDGQTMSIRADGEIVFQVIAHDLIEGQCKVILNAKLCQPGTRIGLSSDYFVYWRDSSSQILSSSQQQLSATSSCCYPASSSSSSRIWGLNFASINDANLFYDICSLNLTDLDFNHEYLKQLANKNKLDISPQIQHTVAQNYRHNAQQNKSPQQQQQLTCSTHKHQARFPQQQQQHHATTTARVSQLVDEASSKCAACQDHALMKRTASKDSACNQRSSINNANHVRKKRIVQNQASGEDQGELAKGARNRSRSTGRVAEEQNQSSHLRQTKQQQQLSQQSGSSVNLKRSQSFSTPTSPEKVNLNLNSGEKLKKIDPTTVTMKLNSSDADSSKQVAQQSLGPCPSDLLADLKFPPSNRITTRRSTGIDSRNIRDVNRNFASCFQGRARIAREQYANSKQLNEFLSLDLANASGNNNNGQQIYANNSKQIKNQLFATHQAQNKPEPSKAQGDLVEEGVAKCEAGTTTDDLQLDSGVKRRMFNELSNDQADKSIKQQFSRSDASSRRRSLERSFGIDMDLPGARGAQQPTTLSPLRQQSESSLISPVENTNNKQAKMRHHSMKTRRKQQVQQLNDEQNQWADEDLRAMRHRAKSSGDATLTKLRVSTRQLQTEHDNDHLSRTRRCFNDDPQHSYLSQANSAPDIRLAAPPTDLCASGHQQHQQYYYAGQQHYHNNNLHLYRRGLAQSYHPDYSFDTGTFEAGQQMQPRYAPPAAGFCNPNPYPQSCPSSLRRPRTARPQQHQQQQQVRRKLDQMQCNCNGNYPCPKTLYEQHGDNLAVYRNNSASLRKKQQLMRDFAAPGGYVNPNQMTSDRIRALEQRGLLHYRPLACEPNDSHHHYHASSQHAYNAYFGHQLAESRSPLNWGAQCESDFDDAPPGDLNDNVDFYDDDDDDDETIFLRGHEQDVVENYYHSDSGRPRNRGRQQYHHQQHVSSRPQSACMDPANTMDRSTSAHLFMRPVANYDKCLNRQALRARPRARSQPARNGKQRASQRASSGGDGLCSAAIIAKSMENVQKLISEVQLELDSFKRQAMDSKEDQKTRLPSSNKSDVNEETQCKQVMTQQHQSASRVSKPSEYKCVGAMRKAGFLWAKKWLNNIPGSIELARGKAWRRYWVTLRGTVLLIHNTVQENAVNYQSTNKGQYTDLLSWIRANCADQQQLLIDNLYHQWITSGAAGCITAVEESDQLDKKQQQADQQQQANVKQGTKLNQGASVREFMNCYLAQIYIECLPRHLIIIDGSIAQPMPEHPRREHVFCLSTRFGDAFLFQAPSSLETDNWILALHNACAASLARNLNRGETVKLFVGRIRHLEMEADKLLFLRQRLESRLTSMCSINRDHYQQQQAATKPKSHQQTNNTQDESSTSDDGQKTDVNLRNLLLKLEKQMIELDRLLEQIHCELYQLKCYLAACNGACNFYNYLPKPMKNAIDPTISQHSTTEGGAFVCRPTNDNADLPDPRNLLKNVSKHTKMLLLNLGVFMVSSIQAYIHARQRSAETIIRRIRWEHEQASKSPGGGPLELDFLSLSLGDSELATRKELRRLDANAQKLIEMSDDVSVVSVKLTSRLYKQISSLQNASSKTNNRPTSDSQRIIKLEERSDWVHLSCELHQSDTCMSILRNILHSLGVLNEPSSNLEGTEFLDYCLIVHHATDAMQNKRANDDDCTIAKRGERLKDWSSKLDHLELRQRRRFEVLLNRSSLDSDQDSDSVPFGLVLEAQLFSLGKKNILSVYCSFVEWRSEAEAKGLSEEDEIISINGIRTGHLDMMFIEWLMSQERQLHLLVASSRGCLEDEVVNDAINKEEEEDEDDNDKRDEDNDDGGSDRHLATKHQADHMNQMLDASHKIIDDAYVSALICPPPPAANGHKLNLEEPGEQQAVEVVKAQDVDANEEKMMECTNDAMIKIAACEPPVKAQFNHIMPNEHAPPMLRNNSRSSETISRPDSEFNSDIVDLVPVIEQPISATPSNQLTQQANSLALLAEETNKLERVRKSLLELILTELSYIIQLEEMLEFFIKPLSECNYLNIRSLKSLGDFLMSLPNLHKKFLQNLLTPMNELLNSSNTNTFQDVQQSSHVAFETSKLELLVELIRDKLDQASSLTSKWQCDEIIRVITQTFKLEVDRLKEYASYSVAYSRLQRILHPKMHALQSQHSLTNSKYEPMSSSHATHQHQHHQSSSSANPLDLLLKGGRNLRDSISMAGSGSSANHHNGDHSHQDDSKVKQKLLKFLANLEKENNNNKENSISIASSNSLRWSPAASRSQLNEPGDCQQQTTRTLTTTTSGTTVTTSSLVSLAQLGSESAKQTNNNQQQARSSFTIHQQSFESYLIRPIQRIVRYPMLLKTILITHQDCLRPKSTSPANNEDLDNNDATEMSFEGSLKETIKLMESVASHVNQVQQIYDQFGDLFETLRQENLALACGGSQQQMQSNNGKAAHLGAHLSSSLHSRRLSQQPIIELDSDHLLHFGQLTWLNSSDFMSSKGSGASKSNTKCQLKQMLFVFDSCVVLICHEQPDQHPNAPPTSASSSKAATHQNLIRYQALIPVSQVQVRTMSEHRPDETMIVNEQTIGVCLVDEQVTQLQGSNQSEGFRWELICCQFNSSELLLQTSKKRSQANNKFSGAAASAKDQRKGKVYQFVSKTSDERNVFLKKIRQTIRDSVSKMSLPVFRQLIDNSNNKQNDCQENTPIICNNNNNKLDCVASEASHELTNTCSSSCNNSTSKTPATDLDSSGSKEKSSPQQQQDASSSTFLAYNQARCAQDQAKKAEIIA